MSAHHAAAAGSGFAGLGPVPLVLAMAALSLLPFALLMVTCFVRVSVVLSILRSAIGAPQLPPTQVLTGLALVVTLAVMAPTGERMFAAVAPVMGGVPGGVSNLDLSNDQTVEALGRAADRAKEPLRDFLVAHTAPRDRATFLALARKMRPEAERAAVGDRDLAVVVPAFVTSELRRAFEIGFLLFLPFLVIDMVVANLLLALGMQMLSPTTVSLPFKLLLFVVADGWALVVRGLMESYL
ncbi:MAG TPA: type III secretion system export apparatus subunit SctR [Polyangia bacterium]|nr:type III secretion system export apparatus subunit SctR [Polyangia bacterium]HVZ74952.1 type III secretion system export apparatus subunit SctR [Polyangia bacterium]